MNKVKSIFVLLAMMGMMAIAAIAIIRIVEDWRIIQFGIRRPYLWSSSFLIHGNVPVLI